MSGRGSAVLVLMLGALGCGDRWIEDLQADHALFNEAAVLPSGGSAVSTFHSMGLYYRPTAAPPNDTIRVRYRKSSDPAWRDGLDLWYDARTTPRGFAEARGSLVNLVPGTEYTIQFGIPNGVDTNWVHELVQKTWSETFPEGAVTELVNGTRTTPLDITSSGTADAYRVWTFPAGGGTTIDVGNAYDYAITIASSYVIIRGLKVMGARIDNIHLLEGAHDVVIEDCEITNWGRFRMIDNNGWSVGVNYDAGIGMRDSMLWSDTVKRIIVQRCKIHTPRYGSTTWEDEHPTGPQAIVLWDSGGNHVFRYNEFYSDGSEGRYMNDIIGAGENFSYAGVPGPDSDIYGNLFKHWRDDAIEADGGGMNVRLWNNYFDYGGASVISTESLSIGPLYIWRNVSNRGRAAVRSPLDSTGYSFSKSGAVAPTDNGRRYVFHNTLLQTPVAGTLYGYGVFQGIMEGSPDRPLENTIIYNNILHIKKSWWESVGAGQSPHPGHAGNVVRNNLYNGVLNLSAESSGSGNIWFADVPSYKPGHGYVAEGTGKYQLNPGAPGHDAGLVVNNFNDGYLGAAPDCGAHEEGSADMVFGVLAGGSIPVVEPVTLPLAINSGGGSVSPFLADSHFVGGATTTNWTGPIDTSGVTDPAPAQVYQSERYGDMTYTLPGLVAGAQHLVRVHFCENYSTGPNQRLFDLAINGTMVLDNFDIFATTGAQHRAVVREFVVAADAGGQIVLDFTTLADAALSNGIEVRAVTPPPPPPTCGNDGVCAQGKSCCGPSGAEHCVVVGAEVCDGFDNDCDGVVDGQSVCGGPACLSPTLLCNGTCVDVTSDRTNCGACGRSCAVGEACTSGACHAPVGVVVASPSCACGASAPGDQVLASGLLFLFATLRRRRR